MLLAYCMIKKLLFAAIGSREEEISCFALTGPVARSDASVIKDYGIVYRHEFDKKTQLAIQLINWNKHYVTSAPVSTLIGLAFKLYDSDHLIGDIVIIQE